MIIYDENHNERIYPSLVKQLSNRQTSLGKHPIFPEEDEQLFEEKLASERFKDVLLNYKRQFNIDEVKDNEVPSNTLHYLRECVTLEHGNEKELIDLAIKMVKEEFDVPDDLINIEAEITIEISSDELEKNEKPIAIEGIEFESHEELVQAKKEVYKRRFVNAMIQGSAKKYSHMFHIVEKELSTINPRLISNYSKMLAGANYMYWSMDAKSSGATPGGICEVDFSKNEDEPSTIKVKAFVFPILVHEIVKGVMEVLSAHGLPKDKKMAEYVIGKADFTAAEPWDMRLGPQIWERFTDCFDSEDFGIKHHVYAELVALPVDEFNDIMREIMAGTKKGRTYVNEKSKSIKEEIRKDDFNSSLITDEFGDDDFFDPNDLDNFDKGILDD